MKGNLIDIAVGFVMGAAFTKIVTVFTQNMVAPLISMLTENVRFDQMEWVLRDEVLGPDGLATTAKVAVSYGMFLTAMIDFIIVAFVMFMVVKGVNRLRRSEADQPAASPAPSNEEKLLMEIRDALKK